MKIVFVSPNQEQLPDPVIPLGLLYLMANTPDSHQKELWDLCFEKEPLAFLQKKIADYAPDLIAMGMRNIQNNDYSDSKTQLEHYKKVIGCIRMLSKAPIVLGGGGFSIMPQLLMKQLRPDFGISSEAEGTFSQLVDQLAGDEKTFDQIGNLFYFHDQKLIVNTQPDGFLDIEKIKPPDRSYVDPRYYDQLGIESIQTKRGCPLKCTYCTYPLIEGKTFRVRQPSAVVDEIMEAKRIHSQMSHFFIVDAVFNAPLRHAKAICREIIDRGLTIPWTCYFNPAYLDEELLALMAEAHCAGVEMGSESGCDDILQNLQKGFTTAQVTQAAMLCRQFGIKDCHTFILGTPGETLAYVQRTLDYITQLNPFSAILMIWTDDADSLGSEKNQKGPTFRDQIKELLWEKREQFPRWILPPLQVNFDAKLFRFLRRRNLQGPLWQHIDRLG